MVSASAPYCSTSRHAASTTAPLVSGRRSLVAVLNASERREGEVVTGEPVSTDFLRTGPLRNRCGVIGLAEGRRCHVDALGVRSQCREVEAIDLSSSFADQAPGLGDRYVVVGLLQPLA